MGLISCCHPESSRGVNDVPWSFVACTVHSPCLFRHLSCRDREKNGDGSSWSVPKGLDEIVKVVLLLILTFLKDGVEVSPNRFPFSVLLQQTLLFLL